MCAHLRIKNGVHIKRFKNTDHQVSSNLKESDLDISEIKFVLIYMVASRLQTTSAGSIYDPLCYLV